MNEIANRAGVNKALLHYYFRTKDLLFQHVLKDTLKEIIHGLMTIPTQVPFKEFLQTFIETHISFVIKHSPIMSFALWEMRKNPDLIGSVINEIKAELNIDPSTLIRNRFQQAIEKNEIRAVDPMQFTLNLVSLNIFPQLAKPMAISLYNIPEEQYEQILKDRKQIVFDLLWQYIKPENQ